MQAMPCPIAREIGELLNLSPGTGDSRISTTSADTGVAGSGGKAGGGGGGRRREGRSSSSPGDRWLHDVMEVAEMMKAEQMEIILDEKVRDYCKWLGSFLCFSPRMFSTGKHFIVHART